VRILRESVVSRLALLMLVLTLGLTPVLLFMTLRGPSASVTVGRFSATSCGAGASERCYSAVVTNTGQGDTGLRCSLIPEGGPPATFLNGTPTYLSGGTIAPGSSLTLQIKLQPSANASPALPKLDCQPG
jgi:hypothetical protein